MRIYTPTPKPGRIPGIGLLVAISRRLLGKSGFNAWDECGNVASTALPAEILSPNQLGRLWHPCDAVTAPSPIDCH